MRGVSHPPGSRRIPRRPAGQTAPPQPPAEPTAGSTIAAPESRSRGAGASAPARVVCRMDPRRRIDAPAPRPSDSRLAPRALQGTFGLINLGPSPDEIRQAELEAKIKSVLRGHYKIGVMGKGGVGKTTCPPASDRSSPSCARRTGWWPSTPTPRSASSAAASTRTRRAPTGSWPPTSTSRRSPIAQPGG